MPGWLATLFGDQLQDAYSAQPAYGLVWRSLRLFLLYRIVLSLALIFFYYSETGPEFLGQHQPQLFASIAILYGSLTLISAFFWHWRLPNPEQQAYLILFIDILAITLLMHASGGVETGLGMLIAISITGGSLIMGGRSALLFAALATLAVLTEQIVTHINQSFPVNYPQAGFLGAVFFATALLTLVLSGRARASEQLAEERQEELGSMAKLNDYIIQHMQTGVLVINAENTILMMNDPAWHLLGMPAARSGSQLGAASWELEEMLNQWRTQQKCDCEPFRIQPQGPEIRPQIRPLGLGAQGDVMLFLEDTSQVQREAQQMKLASLGRLTASIAHEIRNPLGAISHASQLFDESPNLKPADRRLTQIIKTNSARVNQVIENVLQLSRRHSGQPEHIHLGNWLEDVIADIIHTQGFNSTTFYTQIEPDNTQVNADPEQLRQIVTNLCHNAVAHATNKANLQVSLVGGWVDEFNHPVVDVIDNGPGIPPDVAEQIFEPFYTTRNNGTGLGLYIAKELCESNQIRLEYIPGPTGGSCFRLHFPTPEMMRAS